MLYFSQEGPTKVKTKKEKDAKREDYRCNTLQKMEEAALKDYKEKDIVVYSNIVTRIDFFKFKWRHKVCESFC